MKSKALLIFISLSASLNAFSQDTGNQQLPNRIDLSAYCPTKKYQYDATCYAYAFAYTALTINYCVKNNITDSGQVEENAFSPGFIASRRRQESFFNPNCGMNGSYDFDLKIFSEEGCPKLKDFPQDCTAKIPKSVKLKAKETKLDKSEYILTANDPTPDAILSIKKILAQKIPVLIVLNVTDDFAAIKRNCNEVLPILKRGKKAGSAHDICIIGYDDEPSSKFFGRYLVKNNYSYWGDENAMAWIRYEDMMYMITHALYFTIK